MKRAWVLAKQGVAKFGGKVKEYFAESLRLVWSQVVNERGAVGREFKTFNKTWVTATGAEIMFEYKTQQEAQKMLDGFEIGRKIETGVFPTFLSINGTQVSAWNTTRKYKEHKLSLGAVEYKGKKMLIEIEMPEAISLAIYGPFETPSYIQETPAATPDHRCKKCGEYCYGDCTSY